VQRKRVVRKEIADRDLALQVDYLARRRPAVARRYLRAVEDAYRRIAALPDIGRRRNVAVPELKDLRVWPVPGFPRYRIYYRPTAVGVEILRVLHTARDLRRLF